MAVSIFEQRLMGGHPNSLGNTIAVVDEILKEKEKLIELYKCYFSSDAVVRLRTSNAWKRIAKHDISLFLPFLDQFILEISKIDQASTKWTLANLFDYSFTHMTPDQRKKATEILKNNLLTEKDWIVRKNTMDTLGKWAKKDHALKIWIIPELTKLKTETKKIVPRTAEKWLSLLSK
jgi:hypothetical protein